MACEIPVIEREIQLFISECTGEKVRLNLGTEGKVIIETVSPHGSTTLGIFWVKVLQHPNNYPVHQYPYRHLYRAAGRHVVSLRVDTVNIMVCLATGRLTIQGVLALDWFCLRFKAMMDSYVQPLQHGAKELKDPFDAEQRRLIRTVKKQMLHQYIEDWPDVVVMEDMDVLNARQILRQQKEEAAGETEEDSVPVGPLLGEKPSQEFHIDNLLSSTALESHLTKLKEGGMTDGATLYAVWSSLLNRWFSDPHTKVFIITAAIDMATLKRLCHLVLNHRVTAALEMLATPLQSRCGRLADIRREVMEQLPPRDRVFAEYKVYNSMVFPATEFQAKFIAGVRGDSVEVLSTSADAETNHFRAEHCSMVQFQTVSLAEFDRRLLGPVLASVE